MIDKIKNTLSKTKKQFGKIYNIFPKKIKKNTKKLELKKILRDIKNKKKLANRNKYNIQLKLDFKLSNFKYFYVILLIVILLIILTITKSSIFKIQNINEDLNIIKLDENVNINLIERNLLYLKWQLIFNIDYNEIEKNIKDIEQNIKHIYISKSLPNTLNIRLSSYDILFKTFIKWNNYLITSNWVFIPTHSRKNNIENIVIKKLKLESYPNYKKILSNSNLYKIKIISEKIKKNITNLKINNIILYNIEREVHFIINNNTRILFDLNWNIEKQLNQLFVFNKETIDITKYGTVYIDNRIESEVLYCTIMDLKQCIINLNTIYDEDILLTDYKKLKKDKE